MNLRRFKPKAFTELEKWLINRSKYKLSIDNFAILLKLFFQLISEQKRNGKLFSFCFTTQPMLHFLGFISLTNLHLLEHAVHGDGEIYISAPLKGLSGGQRGKGTGEISRKLSMLAMLRLAIVQITRGRKTCHNETLNYSS